MRNHQQDAEVQDRVEYDRESADLAGRNPASSNLSKY